MRDESEARTEDDIQDNSIMSV
jgi:hypothetical protein